VVNLQQEISNRDRDAAPMNTIMDQAQFQHYCRQHTINAETCDLLARIRNSPPARRVRGRVGNVSALQPHFEAEQ